MEEFTEALSVVAKGYDLGLPDWVSNWIRVKTEKLKGYYMVGWGNLWTT